MNHCKIIALFVGHESSFFVSILTILKLTFSADGWHKRFEYRIRLFSWFQDRLGMMVRLFNDRSVAWSEGVRRSEKKAISTFLDPRLI